MSDLVQSTTTETPWMTLPDIRRAPAVFRSALKIAARNWMFGGITFVLPSGR